MTPPEPDRNAAIDADDPDGRDRRDGQMGREGQHGSGRTSSTSSPGGIVRTDAPGRADGTDTDAVGIEAAPGLPPAAIDPQTLRAALGRFATGVTIVSCVDADRAFVGLTVNSFASLSMHPPLVLWSLRESSPSLAAFVQARYFVVNVLAASQLAVSQRFASRAPDKFDAGDWAPGAHGAPLLAGCAAVFQCETVSQQTAGDHRLFIGRVLAFGDSVQPPLLFHGGGYHLLGTGL